MAGLFDPAHQGSTAVPDPSDTANRANQALAQRLATGGTNADTLAPAGGAQIAPAAPHLPTLAGLN